MHLDELTSSAENSWENWTMSSKTVVARQKRSRFKFSSSWGLSEAARTAYSFLLSPEMHFELWAVSLECLEYCVKVEKIYLFVFD